eukprot:GHVS01058260.1.p1 GENE.GHVS01058260.1~~GHVS01058260.1.p1  ORF type:complete len:973 (+),score=159.60 GHVS01058260.1:414-2921(+)
MSVSICLLADVELAVTAAAASSTLTILNRSTSQAHTVLSSLHSVYRRLCKVVVLLEWPGQLAIVELLSRYVTNHCFNPYQNNTGTTSNVSTQYKLGSSDFDLFLTTSFDLIKHCSSPAVILACISSVLSLLPPPQPLLPPSTTTDSSNAVSLFYTSRYHQPALVTPLLRFYHLLSSPPRSAPKSSGGQFSSPSSPQLCLVILRALHSISLVLPSCLLPRISSFFVYGSDPLPTKLEKLCILRSLSCYLFYLIESAEASSSPPFSHANSLFPRLLSELRCYLRWTGELSFTAEVVRAVVDLALRATSTKVAERQLDDGQVDVPPPVKVGGVRVGRGPVGKWKTAIVSSATASNSRGSWTGGRLRDAVERFAEELVELLVELVGWKSKVIVAEAVVGIRMLLQHSTDKYKKEEHTGAAESPKELNGNEASRATISPLGVGGDSPNVELLQNAHPSTLPILTAGRGGGLGCVVGRLVLELVRGLPKLTHASSRSSVVWLAGRYQHEIVKEAVDALRELVITFQTEDVQVKLQVLGLGVKVWAFHYLNCLHHEHHHRRSADSFDGVWTMVMELNAKVCGGEVSSHLFERLDKLVGYLFELCHVDSSYYLRDIAKLYHNIVKAVRQNTERGAVVVDGVDTCNRTKEVSEWPEDFVRHGMYFLAMSCAHNSLVSELMPPGASPTTAADPIWLKKQRGVVGFPLDSCSLQLGEMTCAYDRRVLGAMAEDVLPDSARDPPTAASTTMNGDHATVVLRGAVDPNAKSISSGGVGMSALRQVEKKPAIPGMPTDVSVDALARFYEHEPAAVGAKENGRKSGSDLWDAFDVTDGAAVVEGEDEESE